MTTQTVKTEQELQELPIGTKVVLLASGAKAKVVGRTKRGHYVVKFDVSTYESIFSRNAIAEIVEG